MDLASREAVAWRLEVRLGHGADGDAGGSHARGMGAKLDC